MDAELTNKLDEWLKWDKNDTSRNAIKQLKDSKDVNTLKKLLLNRMEFGTAGLRAVMGPGNSQMNDLTIIQTTQGLYKYASQQFPELNKMGVIVCFDGRHNSRKWAAHVANIFMKAGCLAYLFPDVCPTPLLAFGVRHFKCSLGVMITASHNPKEDNGYKVYWSNGSQIISPHDKGIAACINESLKPLESSWDTDSIYENSLCRNPLPELMRTYCQLQKDKLCYTPQANKQCKHIYTYTAMHGVGWKTVQNICSTFGFPNPLPVKEQVEPDAEMPTVKYPNPEEGRSALNLAMATADSKGSRIILANDPDADRLAVAEKQPDGKWKIFTGNELGAIFGFWLWTNWRKQHPKADVSKVGMLSSTVSSKILQTIATKEGFYFEETLTGFKWMGNLADQLRAKGVEVLFAFEEAIGFMCGNTVLDKDGVGALAVMSELVTSVYNEESTLQGYLDKIFQHYGCHISNNSYYFCYDPPKIVSMFERIRKWPDNPSPTGYPQALGRFHITGIRDLTTGYDDAFPDKKARLPTSKSSQCITFRFDNGVHLTIRTSGTEPKIKYYSELRAAPDSAQSMDSLAAELQELVDLMVEAFYEPKKNGFITRSN